MATSKPVTTVGVAQFASGTDKSANLDQLRTLAVDAAGTGARIVVGPEYAMFAARTLDEKIVAAAEPLDGPFVAGLLDIARSTGIHVVAGIAEDIGEPRISNTLVVAAPDGTLPAVYRKLHLYDAFGFAESAVIAPGAITAAPTFTLDGFTFGLQTCYDLRFPEVTRRLADAGADIVVVAAQWIPGPLKEDHWTTLVRARAIENTAYVVAADQPAPNGAGASAIVDPMGVVLASLGERTGAATAVVDRERIDAVRRVNPCLELRRFTVRE